MVKEPVEPVGGAVELGGGCPVVVAVEGVQLVKEGLGGPGGAVEVAGKHVGEPVGVVGVPVGAAANEFGCELLGG